MLQTIEGIVGWLQLTYAPRALLAGWGVIALSYVVLHGVEKVAQAEHGQRYASMLVNIKTTLVYLILSPIVNFFPGQLANDVVQWSGGSLLNLDLRAIAESQTGIVGLMLLPALALLPLLVFDFFYYWFHRLQHTNKWLWEQHKLHHSEQSLNVTTSLRHHWLEEPLRSFLIMIPMSLLIRMTPVEAGILSMLLAQWGNFIHMNLRLRLGWLTAVFCGPQAHRIHHSIEPSHQNKNFAAFFPMWDVVFRTFHWPERNEFPRTGILWVHGAPTVKEILFDPFVAWRRMFGSRTLLPSRTN